MRESFQLPEPVASLLKLIEEIAGTVERPARLDEILARAGGWIMKALESLETGAHGSIWLTQFSRTPEVETSPCLMCRHVFGNRPPRSRTQQFECGLIGWVATHRELVNKLVHDPSETLSNGDRVVDLYLSWGDPDQTEAELVVPMMFQGRLVGVLNIERPAAERFPEALELAARVLAAHTAQAIHQLEFDLLLRKLLGNTAIKDLTETVVQSVGNFIEAPLACVYLWDMEQQCLKMSATNTRIVDSLETILEPTQACYSAPGIGIVRWVFDHRKYLMIGDLKAFEDRDHSGHESQKLKVRDEILRQRYTREEIQAGSIEETVGQAGASGNDDRRFWTVSVPGHEPWTIAHPVRAHRYRFHGYDAQSVLAVPILDTRGHGSALGVMFFERLEAKPFDKSDITLLKGVADYVGQAIAQLQLVEAQTKERELIAQVVTMGPSSWREEFQNRLERHLHEMRGVMGADLLIVRQYDQRALTLVACDPTKVELRQAWGAPGIEIPSEIPIGEGVSGHAALDRKTIFIRDASGAERQALDATIHPQPNNGETGFVQMLGSEIVVPLMAGNRLVGTLMAVSRRPSSQAARCREGLWECEPQGLQEHHVDFLEHQARWLAPALASVGEMVRRSRHLSCLSVAIRELKTLIGKRTKPELLQIATLVTATHHDGLGFHQAFLASCEPSTGDRTIWVRGNKHPAWGSLDFQEQFQAHQHQATLKEDIQGALSAPDGCRRIYDAWKDFRVQLSDLPEAPCLIVREGAKAAPLSDSGQVLLHVARAVPGDPWSGLLDMFCKLFSIQAGSETARDFQLGMVKLRPSPRYVKQRVIFVTNVGFASSVDGSCTYIDPITLEMISVLDDLGALLSLAKRVSGRYRLAETLRQVQKRLAALDLLQRDPVPKSGP